MKKYYLAVLAIFKNEEMVIKEWLDHHIWQGVEHFYLINNDSDDNYLEIIQPYINSGMVTLYDRPEKYKQNDHYNDIFNRVKDDIEWLAIIDIDEYLFGKNEPLKDYLKKTDKHVNMIVTYWYDFGSNGHIKQPESIRHGFTLRNVVSNKYGNSKGILRNLSLYKLIGQHPHICKLHNPLLYNKTIDNKNLRIYHYRIMSKEYYEKVKMTRGDVLLEKSNNSRNKDFFNTINKIASNIVDTTLSDLVKNGYKNNK